MTLNLITTLSSQRDWHLSVDPHTQMLVPLAKEYGHILQYLKVGPKAYYSIIAPESLASATFTSVKSHHSFWTETWANYLSKGYFGLKWLGNKIKGYPANNISDLNLLRLRIASIPLFY